MFMILLKTIFMYMMYVCIVLLQSLMAFSNLVWISFIDKIKKGMQILYKYLTAFNLDILYEFMNFNNFNDTN